MKTSLYFFCILILSTTLFTACGSDTPNNHLIGAWKLTAVDGEAIPEEQQIIFEFKTDGSAIRKAGTVEFKNNWEIKEDQQKRFLHITDEAEPEVDERLEIKKLDASTLVLLDKQEEITLNKQK